MRSARAAAAAVGVGLLFTACSSTGSTSAGRPISTPAPTESTTATTAPTTATTGVVTGPATDQEVTFESGGLTIHASLRMPAGATGNVPAVVLLAGSGPTDRNGDSTLMKGSIGTLSWLADRFAAEGVASLRYDKLGTGATGLGDVASKPTEVDFDVFVHEARDALKYLADQPGIDTTRLILGGHSEGGLIAMVIADDPADAPPTTGVALFAPPTERYLDLVTAQVKGQTKAAVASGAMSAAAAGAFDDRLDAAVAAVRAGQALPADLPKELTSVFNATTTRFLQQADQQDPTALAAGLGPPHHVLLTCAEKDIQVPCDGVRSLQERFPAGASTFVSFPNTDHVLKDIGAATSDGRDYTKDLPFTDALAGPLHDFVTALG